jgi:hypothetical protein
VSSECALKPVTEGIFMFHGNGTLKSFVETVISEKYSDNII